MDGRLTAALDAFAASEPRIDIWRRYPHITEYEDEATDDYACDQVSRQLAVFLAARDFDVQVTVAGEADHPMACEHVWVTVSTPAGPLNVDFTARQYHNLEHPPAPEHQNLPCPMVWAGAGNSHPVVGAFAQISRQPASGLIPPAAQPDTGFPGQADYAQPMAPSSTLTFTVRYDVPARPNWDALEHLPETNKMRDVNGNSYTRDDLTDRAEGGSFTLEIVEGSVDGLTVGEIGEALGEDLQDVACSFLLTEEDSVFFGGHYEAVLPADPARCAYADSAAPGDAVFMIDRQNVVTSMTCSREDAEIISGEH